MLLYLCAQPKPSSTVCRAADSPCDLVEYCDGLQHHCPSDAYLQDGTECLLGQVRPRETAAETGREQEAQLLLSYPIVLRSAYVGWISRGQKNSAVCLSMSIYYLQFLVEVCF